MKSLFIFLLLTVGQITYAQQSVYFEKFYAIQATLNYITNPILSESGYFFICSEASMTTDSNSYIDFYKLDFEGNEFIHKNYSYSWPYKQIVLGANPTPNEEIVVLKVSVIDSVSEKQNFLDFSIFNVGGDTIHNFYIKDSLFSYEPQYYVYCDKNNHVYNSGFLVDTNTLVEVSSYIIKIDLLGNIVYRKTRPISENINIKSNLCLKDENCLFYGDYFSNNVNYGTLIKVNPTGNTIWEKHFNYSEYYGFGIDSLADGNIILSGGQNNRAFLTKIDTSGEIIPSN